MSEKLDLRYIETSKLVPAPFNPPGRVDMRRLDNKMLAASILVKGVMTPLLVTPRRDGRFTTMEGNRRLAICVRVGIDKVPCIVVKDLKPEDLYVHANIRSNLTQNDILHVYLKKPDAVAPKHRARLSKMESTVGRDTLQAIKKWGGSPATYSQARAVTRYLREDPDGGFTKTVLDWLMLNNQTKAARQAMDNQVPAAQIRRAIAENRPLNLRVVAE